MLKQPITFVDYNGNEVTEDFYFNLNKVELLDLEMSYEDGLEKHLKKLLEKNDGSSIMRIMQDIILKAYGVKSEDGRRFIKNDALREEFVQTEAFSELFMSLALNADKASEFIKQLIPANLADKV